jgi:hypothetical protein
MMFQGQPQVSKYMWLFTAAQFRLKKTYEETKKLRL